MSKDSPSLIITAKVTDETYREYTFTNVRFLWSFRLQMFFPYKFVRVITASKVVTFNKDNIISIEEY